MFLARQAGAYHLLTGNSHCPAPRYDVAALGASLKTAASPIKLAPLSDNPNTPKAARMPPAHPADEPEYDRNRFSEPGRPARSRPRRALARATGRCVCVAASRRLHSRRVHQSRPQPLPPQSTPKIRNSAVGSSNSHPSPGHARRLHPRRHCWRGDSTKKSPTNAATNTGAYSAGRPGPRPPTARTKFVLTIDSPLQTDTLFLKPTTATIRPIALEKFQIFYPAARSTFKRSSRTRSCFTTAIRSSHPRYDLSLVSPSCSRRTKRRRRRRPRAQEVVWRENQTAGKGGVLFGDLAGRSGAADNHFTAAPSPGK
jgi:hypothetical protein